MLAALAAVPQAWAEEPTAAVPAAPWRLRMPAQDAMSFHGMVRYDDAGSGSGAMMYPAPGAVGLLAAVVTHALIVDSAKTRQKAAMDAAADEVLQPYRPVLDTVSAQDLWRRALQRTTVGGPGQLLDAASSGSEGTVLELSPLFRLTRDQSAWVLDTLVTVKPEGAAAPRQLAVRVLSPPRPEKAEGDDAVAYWSEHDGERLKAEAALLLAQAMDLALRHPQSDGEADAPFKTVRYSEGRTERAERGQLLAAGCSRVVIKTLRGTLMSVPVKPDTGASAGCDPAR